VLGIRDILDPPIRISEDPDPTPDPTPFLSDVNDAKEPIFSDFFL
jgi:hypothetical protein